MNDYEYLLAVIIGIVIAVILKRKDIAEILRMHREIKKMIQPV